MSRSPLALAAMATLAVLVIAAPSLAADAASTFKSKCAACHGVDGNGDVPMGKKLGVHPLGGPAVQKQADAALLETLTKGKGRMPAYGGRIDAADLKALVAHLRTFAK